MKCNPKAGSEARYAMQEAVCDLYRTCESLKQVMYPTEEECETLEYLIRVVPEVEKAMKRLVAY